MLSSPLSPCSVVRRSASQLLFQHSGVGIAPPSPPPAALIEPSEKPKRAERKTFGFCVKRKTDEGGTYRSESRDAIRPLTVHVHVIPRRPSWPHLTESVGTVSLRRTPASPTRQDKLMGTQTRISCHMTVLTGLAAADSSTHPPIRWKNVNI